MESPEHERLAIEGYMASQAPDEDLVHLEKLASERVTGQDHHVWDVHTDKGRWWVITGPTNLYSQSQFPSMDVALSFHVGLMARVRQQDTTEDEAPFEEAWRKWRQAGEVLNTANEAEDFKSVGMRCRESLIAFMRKAATFVPLPAEVPPPKAADVKGWAEVLGNVVAPGDSNKAHRSYLKASARETWDLVNWLTHCDNAIAADAQAGHRATEHALTNWTLATIYYGLGEQPSCPICRSYQLRVDFESGDGLGAMEVVVCEKCGWRGDGVFTEPEEPRPPRAPPEGECITVDVPLYPPPKRR